jgi:iron complex transport system permease protein
MTVSRRPGWWLSAGALTLSAALVVSLAVALCLGPVAVPLDTVLEVVARRLRLGGFDSVTRLDDRIVWQLRLPRVLGAAATGAVLAVIGAALQSLTRNDLADPYLLGVSSGASVGAVSVIVLGFSTAGLAGPAMLTLAAFLGALGALAAVLLLATGRSGELPPSRTVLAGVAVAQLCSAVTAFVVIVSGERDAARRVLAWTLGSFGGVRWGSAVFLMLVAVAALGLVWSLSSQLDAFAFGEVAATSLGVNVERLRWGMLAGTALLVACVVAFTGAIGFVGLVVPHLVRLVAGPMHVRLVPLCALGGALLLVWSDTFARILVQDQELPVGVLTAAVGAPVFALLLRRQARRS